MMKRFLLLAYSCSQAETERRAVRIQPGIRPQIAAFLALVILATAAISMGGHGIPGHHDLSRYGERNPAGHNQGDGASGVLAAWLFVIANVTVALSISLKIAVKAMSPGDTRRRKIEGFNQTQKKYLRPVHYWLNPIAMIVAITHFYLSQCTVSIFPELGMAAMILISAAGLLIWLKLAPAAIRRLAFQVHTSPFLFIATVSILLLGHSLIG